MTTSTDRLLILPPSLFSIFLRRDLKLAVLEKERSWLEMLISDGRSSDRQRQQQPVDWRTNRVWSKERTREPAEVSQPLPLILLLRWWWWWRWRWRWWNWTLSSRNRNGHKLTVSGLDNQRALWSSKLVLTKRVSSRPIRSLASGIGISVSWHMHTNTHTSSRSMRSLQKERKASR